MSESFNIEIISPERKLLVEKINSATVPSFEGDMTILSRHIPIITFLRPGIIKINDSNDKQYFIEEGTVEFSNNNLIILSSTIIEFRDLSREKISNLIEDCKNKLNQDKLDDKTQYIISHKIDCLSRINL